MIFKKELSWVLNASSYWCTSGALGDKSWQREAIAHNNPFSPNSLILLLLIIVGCCRLLSYTGLLIHWSYVRIIHPEFLYRKWGQKSVQKTAPKQSNAVILPEYGISLNHPSRVVVMLWQFPFGVSIPVHFRQSM